MEKWTDKLYTIGRKEGKERAFDGLSFFEMWEINVTLRSGRHANKALRFFQKN